MNIISIIKICIINIWRTFILTQSHERLLSNFLLFAKSNMQIFGPIVLQSKGIIETLYAYWGWYVRQCQFLESTADPASGLSDSCNCKGWNPDIGESPPVWYWLSLKMESYPISKLFHLWLLQILKPKQILWQNVEEWRLMHKSRDGIIKTKYLSSAQTLKPKQILKQRLRVIHGRWDKL